MCKALTDLRAWYNQFSPSGWPWHHLLYVSLMTSQYKSRNNAINFFSLNRVEMLSLLFSLAGVAIFSMVFEYRLLTSVQYETSTLANRWKTWRLGNYCFFPKYTYINAGVFFLFFLNVTDTLIHSYSIFANYRMRHIYFPLKW